MALYAQRENGEAREPTQLVARNWPHRRAQARSDPRQMGRHGRSPDVSLCDPLQQALNLPADPSMQYHDWNLARIDIANVQGAFPCLMPLA